MLNMYGNHKDNTQDSSREATSSTDLLQVFQRPRFAAQRSSTPMAVDPRSWFEVPPSIPPLEDALDEAQHEQQKSELAQAEQAEKAAEEAKATEEAERLRQARIDEEYISAEPMDIESQVERIVVEQLAQLRQEVSQEYMAEISKLKEDIHNLGHH